ncbi:MAG: protein kinase [Alphaproteobacteria bacterium]|nr:protein kinase [Alphaproteobacteria bacterium]
MVDAALQPGQILGGRFAVVGVLGSGGTATVYLAVDQLRGEQIALKVVHAHLSRDPATRRRLRREVAASALLAHEAALVPWDLHELDGRLCLTMPYHPGQTLTEHVGAKGAMAPDAVRQLGIRIAEALAAAHRTGLLHRDVTGNNILVEAGGNAVITDFGMARVESQATKSTGMLGTAGYAAPEVYSGERSDPRTDLYGLGCALYLAATGKTPFGTDSPMAALQRQLEETYTPVRELNPAIPEDLARTIESLLRKSPADRPQGAREVADALRAGVPAGREAAEPVASVVSRRAHIEPGTHVVVVREREEDRARRRQLRVDAKKERKTLETEVARRARELVTGVLAYVGLHSGEDPTPEDLLVRAIAEEAGITSELKAPPALVEQELVLVEGVSPEAARRIAREARSAGFTARHGDPTPPGRSIARVLMSLVVAGWVLTSLVASIADGVLPIWIGSMVLFTVFVAFLRRQGRRLDTTDLPVAYTNDLTRWMKTPEPGRFALDASPAARAVPEKAPEAPVEAASTRGGKLLDRVRIQLDGLKSAVDTLELPDVARSDLRDTARDLDARAVDLADDIDRIDAELAAGSEDGSWIEPRLDRLRTKQRGGEPVDAGEITRLEKALDAHREAEALVAKLDSQLTAATAEMLEIAATAARVRRELLSQPEPEKSASEALERLRKEAELADRARREMGRRAAREG